MSVFDLRRKGFEWDEKEEFDDAIWRDGLGRREAAYYQRRALPLSLLAAGALADIGFPSEAVVHCFLDGNTAPFSLPHDWAAFLRCRPDVRSLMIVYIDIGSMTAAPGQPPPPMPYGTLLRPTEEGRVGDRVARAARFLGTYKEFKEHCRDLPGLVVPHVALWADVPLFGFSDDDLSTRLEAFELLCLANVPSIMTQGAEIPVRDGPPFVPRPDEHASFTMAALELGLETRMAAGWCWNRFVVPLDRGQFGILAAHALLGVVLPKRSSAAPSKDLANTVKAALKERGVTPKPYQLPVNRTKADDEMERMHREQWEAFCKKRKEEGHPVKPMVNPEDMRDFYEFCGIPPPPLGPDT